ncbi:MAG: hypothetical protein AMXMBFR36_00390 [Acidobacteriota bacterium]
MTGRRRSLGAASEARASVRAGAKRLALAPALLLLASTAPLAAQPQPEGGQFQINAYTTSHQSDPSVARTPDGGFVVAWSSYGSFSGGDPVHRNILVRRFGADGAPLEQDFQISVQPYTWVGHDEPSVATWADGNFVVAWHSNFSDASDQSSFSVQGRRYAADGSPLTGQFQVNTYTTGPQATADVTAAADGGFVAVWRSTGSAGGDTSGTSIQGARFDENGEPVGTEFQVNTYTTNNQYSPAIAAEADGGFVVVWESLGSPGNDSSEWSIQGRRYAADGAPLAAQFQVNTYTTGTQAVPDVAALADGGFVVVWAGGGSPGVTWTVQGRRYGADGSPLGAPFQISTWNSSHQSRPAVAAGADGGFVVVWHSVSGSPGGDLSGYSIQGRRYAANGSPDGPQFQVNTYTTNHQREQAVEVLADGRFVVAWSSNGATGGDTSGYSVQGQRYAAAVLFADGFETGDTTGWSMTVP